MQNRSKTIPLEETEDLALRIAEQTDMSVQQAKELIARHGNDLSKIEREARNFKAES